MAAGAAAKARIFHLRRHIRQKLALFSFLVPAQASADSLKPVPGRRTRQAPKIATVRGDRKRTSRNLGRLRDRRRRVADLGSPARGVPGGV